MNKIQSYLLAFYKHYEKEYYCELPERLSAMKMCIHYMLHVSESIFQTGPYCTTWQYLIERVCGMLLPLIKSKLHPYKNLSNNIHLQELFNYLRFNQTIYNQIFPPAPIKNHDEHLAYSGENNQDFYFPSIQHNLTLSELRKIKQHFSTITDVSDQQLISFSQTGTKYGRLRTKDGHYISSKWIRRNKDWSRINYTVMVKIEIDIYANFPKQQLVFEVQDFYAIVEYYLTYEFEGSKVMLAYVQ